MIRAANTGVSAVIDAYGRVLASLDMQQQGIIDHRLPPRARGYALQPLGRLDAARVLVVFLGVGVAGGAVVERPAADESRSIFKALRFSLHYRGRR